jgi:hypothetical protein
MVSQSLQVRPTPYSVLPTSISQNLSDSFPKRLGHGLRTRVGSHEMLRVQKQCLQIVPDLFFRAIEKVLQSLFHDFQAHGDDPAQEHKKNQVREGNQANLSSCFLKTEIGSITIRIGLKNGRLDWKKQTNKQTNKQKLLLAEPRNGGGIYE